MIVTLSGSNSFALLARLNQLSSDFIAENGELGLERIDAQEVSFERIFEAAAGLPFLSDKKMIIIRDASLNKDFMAKFEQIFDNLPESNELILVETKLDKRLGFYKFLKKNSIYEEFNDLDANNLSRWLVGVVERQNGKLKIDDARYLVDRVGANQQLLANEIDKLLLYSSLITRDSIDLLTDQSPHGTVFQLMEAAFNGQSEKTMSIYAQQRALKVEPKQIIAMLAWQLHILAIIKAAGDRALGQIAKDSKINPFVLQKSQVIARNLKLSDIKLLISDLLNIDIKSKTSKYDVDEAIQNYLLKMSLN